MIILCDLDHCLANSFWRDDMIRAGDWDAYHAASADDEPVADIVEIVRIFSLSGLTVIGLTTRPEKWRTLTMSWLLKHDIPLDELLMRPDNDFRPAPEIKVEQARPYLKDTALVLDDRDDVCAAFRALGVTVLQVFARKT